MITMKIKKNQTNKIRVRLIRRYQIKKGKYVRILLGVKYSIVLLYS